MLNKELLFLTFAFFTPTLLLASGGSEHHATIFDLFWPAFNVSIVFGFLIWKLKKPLKKYFDNYSEDTESLAKLAQTKIDEAKKKKEEVDKKIDGEREICQEILSKAHDDGKEFDRHQRKLTEEQVSRIEHDANKNYHHERVSMIKKMEEDFIDEIIDKAKDKVSKSKQVGKSVSLKILSEL